MHWQPAVLLHRKRPAGGVVLTGGGRLDGQGVEDRGQQVQQLLGGWVEEHPKTLPPMPARSIPQTA